MGVAGLQFTYLFYVDRLDRERKKRVHELEHECKQLSVRLKEAERRVEEQEAFIETLSPGSEEAWADVIDDR